MRFHLLAPEVRCPNCSAGLKFLRVRGGRDLYQCTSGVCKRQVMHYRNNETQTCGYASVFRTGVFGKWTACGEGEMSARPRNCEARASSYRNDGRNGKDPAQQIAGLGRFSAGAIPSEVLRIATERRRTR
jgi:hypothetical protein